jgi:hypothetical protein
MGQAGKITYVLEKHGLGITQSKKVTIEGFKNDDKGIIIATIKRELDDVVVAEADLYAPFKIGHAYTETELQDFAIAQDMLCWKIDNQVKTHIYDPADHSLSF